jgi:hypothetical protein
MRAKLTRLGIAMYERDRGGFVRYTLRLFDHSDE